MRWFLGFAGLFLSLALAQFNPGTAEYYAQCRALYEKQALAGARDACELSLVANPNYVPALKLLARVHLDEGNYDNALELIERLKQLAPDDLITRTLEARYLLYEEKPAEALSLVMHVPGAEAAWVRGRALEALGRFQEALEAYREAAILGEERALIDAAVLLERMGKPELALKLLRGKSDPHLLPLQGRLLWSAGRLQEAAITLERALKLLPRNDPHYTEALRILTRVYYGMGDTRRGARALQQLSGRVNLAAEMLRAGWLWLLGLVAFVGLHLFGESRIEPISTLEIRTGNAWGLGRVYGAMLLAWLVGAVVAVQLGLHLYHNWLAAFTPVQAQVVRPAFFIAAALTLGVLGRSSLKPEKNGGSVLGRPESWAEGLWVGVLLAALLIGYAWFSGRTEWLEPVPFSPLRPLGAAALASLALMEPILRVRLPDSLRLRYGNEMVPFFATVVAGMFLISPVLLWWVASAVLLAVFFRLRGLLPLMTSWVVMAALLLGAGYFPLARALF